MTLRQAWNAYHGQWGKVARLFPPTKGHKAHTRWVHVDDVVDGDVVQISKNEYVHISGYDNIRSEMLDEACPKASASEYLQRYLEECIPPLELIQLENIRAEEPVRTKGMSVWQIESNISRLVDIPALANWLLGWNRLTMQFVITPHSELFWVVLDTRRWLQCHTGQVRQKQ
jgi:hypothetical protein